mmetsp:Transcript_25551/g.51943  ORF Transcript_25551/g.51943 Transcript_25551/m.51943 type:complete len:288 (-) Transcript_25551:381-1244(-)
MLRAPCTPGARREHAPCPPPLALPSSPRHFPSPLPFPRCLPAVTPLLLFSVHPLLCASAALCARWAERRTLLHARVELADAASHHGGLDAALVVAARDLEGAAVAPVRVPRVRHQPVLLPPLITPPHDLDGVAAELLPGGVLVDAALVRQEVGVHCERRLHGAVVEELVVHVLRLHRVDARPVVARLRLLAAHTPGRRLALTARLVVLRRDVVLAWGKDVRVFVFRCEAVCLEEIPCAGGKATVATEPALVLTARQHVLCGKVHVYSSVACDAKPVRHRFDSAESPA